MKKAILIVVVLVVAGGGLGLLARNVASQDAADAPETWLDSPLNRMRIPLAPFEIVIHVSDETAATRAEISINDVLITTLDAPAGQTLAAFRYMWTPPDVGEYRIKVRGQNQAGTWSKPVEALVFVGVATPTPTLTFTPTMTMTPTLTLTPTVTPSPTNTPTPTPMPASFVGLPSFTPEGLGFGTECQVPAGLVVSMSVNNWQNVRGVFVFYRLLNETTGESAEWEDTYMNHNGNGSYEIQIMPFASSQYQTWLREGRWLNNHSGRLLTQFIIENQDGSLIRSDVYRSVMVMPCYSVAPTIRPTSVPTLEPTPTRIIVK